MRRLRTGVWAMVALLWALSLVVARGSAGSAGSADSTPAAEVTSCVDTNTTVEPGPATGPEPGLDLSNFDRSTVVDNRFFPLQPGTRMIHEGVTIEDGEPIAHRVVFTVTDLVKVIDGVPTVVILEYDYSDGELAEAELAFFAQANDGTVWRFGEYPESYEGGKIVEVAAWIHGREGARAGIAMKAQPKLGSPSYAQGWGPAVGWVDRAIVHGLSSQTCVRAGCFKDVLVMDEFGLDEPTAHQLKYFAPGVGNVRVGWYGDDQAKETLELVSVVKLDAAQLAAVRAAALAQERRAYQTRNLVYARTAPMTRAG